MRVKRHLLLYFACLPWNLLVAWPVVLLIRALWGKDLRWETPPPYTREDGGGGGPCLSCQIKEGSFPVRPGTFPKGWYMRRPEQKRPWGGTSLGHGVFYGPFGRDADPEKWSRTQAHEHIHVEQAEVSMLGSFIVGLGSGIVILVLGHPVAALVTFLVIWTLGYFMMALSGWLAALLRGEEAYWGSTHEESARAQDDRLA